MNNKKRYKNCFISDLHLGCNKTIAPKLYSFLKNHEFDNLYLVGDVVDIQRMQSSGFMKNSDGQIHINIIQRILKLSKKGTKVFYIYGNHDEFVKNFIESNLDFGIGNISFRETAEYIDGKGKKYIVMHGHQFDLITLYHPFITKLGDHGYEIMIVINKYFNRIRSKLGLSYWSLSKYMKQKVKGATQYISDFSDNVSKYAIKNNYDGIIVGHIHEEKIGEINGIIYVNCGCWTDESNCTAIVENDLGELEIIRWNEVENQNS